jgi:putative membrane-bound dehydrogenase-like protein
MTQPAFAIRRPAPLRSLRLLISLCLGIFGNVIHTARADDPQLLRFDRQQLTGTYFSEGIAVGDINGDQVNDVVYGPYWFAGPKFIERHEIYPVKPQPMEAYADNFFSWIYDFDGDGASDVLVVGFPGTPAYVYQNPGHDKSIHWTKHQVFDWVSNESPQWVNVVGDERPELVCTRDGFFGFATVDWSRPWEPWKFHPISEKITATKFGHGLGVGDVNGDGLADIIHANGWFEQPAQGALDGRWLAHEVKFSTGGGGAEMVAYDVDGDGDNDIITSESAHNFGLSWYEQREDQSFIQHVIMGKHPAENKYGVLFSELHSLALADMDGDGLQDIITGKTYWSHHRQSPMWDAGAVVTWFKLVRNPPPNKPTGSEVKPSAAAGVDWLPFQAHGETGIGRQLTVTDINGDGLPDIATGGMLGANLLMQSRVAVTREQFDAAQPKLYDGPPAPVAAKQPARAKARSPLAEDGHVPGAIEGETLNAKVTAGTAAPQGMKNFAADRWSGDSQLWWHGAQPGDKLSLELDVFQSIQSLELSLTRARDYGIVQIELDGQPLQGPLDLYDPQVVTTGLLKFETPDLKRGKHELAFVIVGANPQAEKRYMFGLDFIRFTADGEKVAEVGPKASPAPNLAADEYPHQGLPAEAAAAAMRVPEGFRVTVCASEPDVKQPIALALDDRGRTWIAEAYEYPQRAEGDRGRDRILIFEDTNGDGRFDSRKVFADGLNLISGLEVGFGGVWVGAAPYLMFIPDADGDDVPDSAPRILLDGWGYQDTHETLNAFCWGPDGWLYGCHGVFTHSLVGKPGATEEQRQRINAGVWRYHPLRHEFEVFAHGTSNPWGVDFNDHGEAFVTACVIPHLYHMIPGARYQRQAGEHFNPYTYNDIKTIADHLHYLGATPHSGNGKSDEAGGGHAHAGAMFYQGGAWPRQYHDVLFMNNIHGQRLNTDILEPSGSGYIGHHGPDFLLTGDQASQILNMRYGPDGQVIFIDWYDMQACHRREVEVHDRSNGRIYKVSYGKSPAVQVDLRQLDDLQLVELALHSNEWYVRHARRVLQERSAQREIKPAAIERLNEIATTHESDTRRLRAMWARHAIGPYDDGLIRRLVEDESPHVRGWLLRLVLEQQQGRVTNAQMQKLTSMAANDPSPVVRRSIASVVDRLPLGSRWSLIEALTTHAEDASDHNLPLMLWYVMEPLAEVDPQRAMQLGIQAGKKIPMLREFMLRRLGASGDPRAIEHLVLGLQGLQSEQQAEIQLSFLAAIRSALAGTRTAKKPAAWDELFTTLSRSANEQVQLQAAVVGITFGTAAASERLLAELADATRPLPARSEALTALLAAKRDIVEILVQIVGSAAQPAPLREAAILGLAQYDVPSIPPALVAAYSDLNETQRRAAIATLAGRASSARALLVAIGQKTIPAVDLTADLARQIEYFKDDEVTQLLSKNWGQIRETTADKAALMEAAKQLINRTNLPRPDLKLGRAVFAKTCQRCHMLYGVGEKLGPDLTGSNRANLDYLLENIYDPSAVMAHEYRQSVFMTEDGQVITGILRSESDKAVTIQTAEATLVLPLAEIAERRTSEISMMPDNQLQQFSPHEIRSLIAYLRGKAQVELPAP